MKIGIYMFTYKDRYAYVGQSVNLEGRIKKHKRDIANNTHPNMEKFDKYDLSDFKFKVIEECSAEELNVKEQEVYEAMSLKYIMLNKRKCGLQGVVGDRLVFYGDKNPSFEYKDGNFYIEGIKVDKVDDMFCISDITNYILNHSDYDFRQERILIGHSFIDRINCLYKCNIPKDRKTASHLKEIGIYKVKGARENKRVYCKFGVFITYVYMSCPQLAASVCILVGGGKKLSNV